MGQAIAVVSGKGGTGKTAFTANVGMALAQMGYATLCLDCDIGLRNLDIAMAMTDRAVMDFTDVLAGRCALEEAAVSHPSQRNLYLLTAPARTDRLELDVDGFQRMLRAVREKFDYCLMDAPAGLGDGFQLAVRAADRAAVITTTDASSLRDAQRTAMELDMLPRGRVHLVVNRCRKKLMKSLRETPPAEISGVKVAQFKDYAGGSVVDCATGAKSTMELSGSNVLRFELADGTSIIVRPSGTEPKIKVYILTKGADAAERDANIKKYGEWVDTLKK